MQNIFNFLLTILFLSRIITNAECEKHYRSVAQFGRALRSGRRGRGFESRRFDSLAGAPEHLRDQGSGVFRYAIMLYSDYKVCKNLIATIES